MLVADSSSGDTSVRSRPERPPSCARCSAPSWWNGWRAVAAVVRSALGAAVERCRCWVPRAKCSTCKAGFTCRPPELYPRRQFQLDVVADVVAATAVGDEAPTKAAARVSASPTSARRWLLWIAELTSPEALLAVAQKLDPDAPVGAGAAALPRSDGRRARAGVVLDALEQLGAALVRAGVSLVSKTGLGRVLEWQHRAHGEVVHLVVEPRSLSPAMELGQHEAGM